MSRVKTKKEVPLAGELLSTGVLLSKATATQLNMEAGRLTRFAAQRLQAGANPDSDDQFRAALDRSKMILQLGWQRISAKANAAGVTILHPSIFETYGGKQ
jgi:hypothetical protein